MQENYGPILLNIRAKILSEILANQIEHSIRSENDQVGSIPGTQRQLTICDSMDVLQHTTE